MSYGDTTHCVACGKRIELYGNHHCDEKFEKRRQATERGMDQDYNLRRPAEATRINYGFYLLSLRGDF